MKIEKSLIIIPALLIIVACQTVHPPSSESDMALEAKVNSDQNLKESEATSAESEDSLSERSSILSLTELREMSKRLENMRHEMYRQRLSNGNDRHRMLEEVEGKLNLPESYGRTVRITPDTGSIKTPPGPMQKIIDRELSMRLRDADVEELLMELSAIEGLNIIADQALTSEQRITVNFEQVPLRELLQYAARNMGLDFQIGRNVIWVTESEDTGGGPKLETRIYNLRKGFIPQRQQAGSDGGGISFGGGDDGEDGELLEVLEELLGGVSPEESVLRFFKNRQLLVLRNTPENLRLAEEVILKFDVIPKQVLIEARFLTVSQKDLNQLGINIESFQMTRPEGESLEQLDFSSIFPTFQEGVDSPALTVSGILGNHEYQATLRALQKLTDAETLSAPRLTLLNNQSAEIRRGSNFYYWEEWELVTGTVIADGSETDDVSRQAIQPVGQPTEIQQGITLRVKVSVGEDGKSIMLSLAPSIKNVDQLNFYGAGTFSSVKRDDAEVGFGNGDDNETSESVGYYLPEVSESSVNTAVAVESGETVVLGGIMEHRVQEELHKVPLLGDLPLIGGIFRRTLISREPRHLLIFVTARVVNPRGEYLEVSEL